MSTPLRPIPEALSQEWPPAAPGRELAERRQHA
jgi:hypothetical protein